MRPLAARDLERLWVCILLAWALAAWTCGALAIGHAKGLEDAPKCARPHVKLSESEWARVCAEVEGF